MISAILLRDIETYAANFKAANPLLRRARNGEVTYATVERYLASVHYLLEHTPQFLALARARARATGQMELATYFESKLGEEAGHVEWAEADLGRLSALSGVAGPRRPARAVVELMRVVREAIEDDPVLYLPYILFSEYFTVLIGPEWLRALQERCGIPATAMTAVSQHVELDKDHVVHGCREIDSLTRGKADHAPLRAILSNTMSQFSAFCDELCAAA